MTGIQWKCRNCDRNFETRGQRDDHNRVTHQKRAINSNLGDRDAIVERVEGQRFACVCKRRFWHASSLQRHKRKCNALILMIENESENEEGTRRFMAQMITNLLMIELNNDGMDSSADAMDLDGGDRAIDMPICIDETYDLIVCKDCGIGVPFEHVPSHLSGKHGIKVTLEQVMTQLNLETEAMTVAQAEDWIKSVWLGRGVQNVPNYRIPQK